MNRDELVWKASHEYGITLGIHYKAVPTYSAYKNIWTDNKVLKSSRLH